MSLINDIRKTWNTFTNRDPTEELFSQTGYSVSSNPSRPILTRGNEKSILTSIIVRMAIDAASLDYTHCNLDEEGRFLESRSSGLNECLSLAANLDQSALTFMQDVIMTMLDKGVVAIVPTDCSDDPMFTDSYDIYSMRAGEIIEWFPKHVKIRLYNENTGLKKDIKVLKRTVAIIQNPLYSIMNETNSSMQRLRRKISLLDVTDENTASGKLDLIVQLPYTIKSEEKKKIAAQRMNDLQQQLAHSQYGVAYLEGTEKLTQLNRSLENNLFSQVEFLLAQVLSQIGMTQSILDGTADEQTFRNYYTRSIEPIVTVIVLEMRRTFLSKTARTQRQSIEAFRDPFKMVPISQMAEIADKFTRNEILSSNEIRQIIGRKPSKDKKADQLVNSNISQTNQISESTSPQDTAGTDQSLIEGGYINAK